TRRARSFPTRRASDLVPEALPGARARRRRPRPPLAEQPAARRGEERVARRDRARDTAAAGCDARGTTARCWCTLRSDPLDRPGRSEEHTSELQSRENL